MLNDCLNFLIAWFGGLFNFMDSFLLFTGVSLLGLIVAFFILYLVVDNFLPKG